MINIGCGAIVATIAQNVISRNQREEEIRKKQREELIKKDSSKNGKRKNL